MTETGIIFQSGRNKRAYFFNSLETFNILRLNLKRTCRRLQNTNFKMQENILRYRQIFINCVDFPRTIQATSTELYIRTSKNAFDTAYVKRVKNIWNSAIHWCLCNCGIIRLFTAYVRPVIIRPATRDY